MFEFLVDLSISQGFRRVWEPLQVRVSDVLGVGQLGRERSLVEVESLHWEGKQEVYILNHTQARYCQCWR